MTCKSTEKTSAGKGRGGGGTLVQYNNSNGSIKSRTALSCRLSAELGSLQLKGHCIEFKYYADGKHSGLTPPGNNS